MLLCAPVPCWFALDLDVDDPSPLEGDGDGAMQVGAVDVGPGRFEIREDVGVGMPKGVVDPDPDEGDLRAGSLEEPARVRVSPVVGDLQDVRAQRVRLPQHEGLREDLGITGEQHPPVGVIDPQHEGDLVEIGAHRAIPGG